MHKLWKRADQGKTSKKLKRTYNTPKIWCRLKLRSTEYLSRRPKVQIRTLYESLMHSRRLGEGGGGMAAVKIISQIQPVIYVDVP
jgi:hypothetical protein